MGVFIPSNLPLWGRWQREVLTEGALPNQPLPVTGPLRLAPLGTSSSGGGF